MQPMLAVERHAPSKAKEPTGIIKSVSMVHSVTEPSSPRNLVPHKTFKANLLVKSFGVSRSAKSPEVCDFANLHKIGLYRSNKPV